MSVSLRAARKSAKSYTVHVNDTNGLLAVTQEGADAVTGSGSKAILITGNLADIKSSLATLTDTDAIAGQDTITLSASSLLGGTAQNDTINVTVNGPPVVTAPTSVSTSAGKPTAISGVSLSETGSTLGKSFTVTLQDTNGLLSATGGLGAGVSGTGTTSLTISGNLVEVNSALATLSDTDSVSPSDVISISSTDSLGGIGSGSIAVNVTSAPVITAPSTATIGVNQADSLGAITLAENGALPTALFKITLSDISGLLSATASGAATVSGGGTIL